MAVQAAGSAAAWVRLNGFAVLPPQAVETVSAPVSGFIKSLLVGPTDALRAGQAVAVLHSAELMQWQREYIQLQAQARQAQDRLSRSERLLAEGIVPEARVREERYAHTQAQVALRERQQTLQLAGWGPARLQALAEQTAVQAELTVSTAREGSVLEVMAGPGQRLEAGAPLIKLARSGQLALELQATAAQADGLQAGASVKVAGCPQAGRVRGLGPLMRGGNQAVTVHVDLPAGSNCLRANQAVEAEVQARAQGTAQAWQLPASAVFQQGGRDHVFVLEGERFRALPVQVQSRQAERVVLSGALAVGSQVASRGIGTLKGAWLGMGEDSGSTAAPGATPAASAAQAPTKNGKP